MASLGLLAWEGLGVMLGRFLIGLGFLLRHPAPLWCKCIGRRSMTGGGRSCGAALPEPVLLLVVMPTGRGAARRTNLRDRIAGPFATAAKMTPPIVSLYSAGKLCQFWNTARATLQKSLNDCHSVFSDAARKAGLKPPYSVRMATLLGLCIIDDGL